MTGSKRRRIDRTEVADILSRIVGQEAGEAAVGFGSFTRVDFGEPRPLGSGRFVRGTWRLSTDNAVWRIDGPEGMVGASEDDRETMSAAVQKLTGRRLIGASVASHSPQASFEFEGGYELTVFPVYSSGYEHWMLFMPDGMVLGAGPGDALTLEPEDGAGDQKH